MDPAAHSALLAQGFALIETHISRVYLARDAVFKTKRPVDLGFLDFTSLAKREHACEAEVTLNQRLAPDVYLGVVALVREASGHLSFIDRDQLRGRQVLEWAVHMRRLADEARADVRLANGALELSEIDDIAARLAHFHAHARRDGEIPHFGAPESVARNVEENFAQVAALPEPLCPKAELAALESYQRSFLAQRADLFRLRIGEGFVRDGHGDLRLEHIYRLAGGGHIMIDCIEFNDRFRFADVCSDLAFLSMDLRLHGRLDLAELLLAGYARESSDYGLYELIDFYESYRAFVRAKVSAFLAQDPGVTEATRERARASARRYYLLALSALRPALARPRVIVCMGMIASGKSTLADALALRLALPLLSADRTRKELSGVSSREPLHDPAFHGAYAPERSEKVYATLRQRAASIVRSGRSVILDATFSQRAQRKQIVELSAQWGAEVTFLVCHCSKRVSMERLREREKAPSISDGRAEIYEEVARRFEPPSAEEPFAHRLLNTEAPLEQTLAAALLCLRADPRASTAQIGA